MVGLFAPGFATLAPAGSLGDEPFNLRLGMAFDRATAYTDVVGLSASAAYPYPSSVNPAAGDVLREPPNHFTLVGTLTGSYVAFGGGASLTAGAASASYRPPGSSGTVVVSYTRVDSHDAVTHQGEKLGLASNQLNISYSHLIGSRVSIGAGVRLSDTDVRVRGTQSLEVPVDEVSTAFVDFPRTTDTESLGVEATLGVFWRPTDQWSVGAQVGLGWTRSETTGRIDLPPDFGSVRIDFSENTRSVNVRAGIGWRPSPSIGVYADGQYLRLLDVRSGSPDNSAEVGRVLMGVEYMPLGPLLALRVGGSVDTDRQLTVSTGIGFYPSRYFQGELAYVYNAFPEVRKEFGRAHLISLSFAFVF